VKEEKTVDVAQNARRFKQNKMADDMLEDL
jgi:hypothetical protein